VDNKPIPFEYNDGGRKDAGFTGYTGDCVVRSIAIATEQDYRKVYDDLNHQIKVLAVARGHRKSWSKTQSSRNGVSREVYEDYLRRLGWIFTATMRIGSGCMTHLDANELPGGRLIVRLSKHMAAVIDGVVHDTHDPSRGGTRCVYGYYSKESEAPAQKRNPYLGQHLASSVGVQIQFGSGDTPTTRRGL
jgi:hypothetical protein